MAVNSTAGTTISISAAAPATFDDTGYAALTWTVIGEVTNLGEQGREYAVINHNPIATRATQKRKGSYNEGSIALTMGYDEDDAGQILLTTASASDNNYSFKITYQSGAKRYFQAQVTSLKETAGGVDDILGATANLEITSNAAGVGIVKVAAP